MNALSPLAYDLVKEARNAVLPSKKVKLALQKLFEAKKITVENQNSEVCDCIDTSDQMVSVFLSQFRKAKQDRDCYMSLVRRMSDQEKRALDEVLGALDLSQPVETEEGQSTVGETAW